MTNEQIIIRLTKKVLTLEAGIEEQSKSIDGWITRYKEEKQMLDDAENRIKYALTHCVTCSPKPGMPTLCKACQALQSGIMGS